ncbi:MAG: ABC transporter permease [Actinomycetota bacterium]|nr:ABC transporter permease [Actinomycetota bacterium]
MYGALGLGLVLVHRSSGVVNFAHGAMAMWATYVFAELRTGGRVPFPAALGLSVAFAAVLGLAVYVIVFRPLRTAPALARVVASVGLLAVLQATVVLRFGADARPVPAILPARPLSLLGLAVPRDRLYLAALVVAAAAVLWAVYRFTRFGVASRAAAEDQTSASLLGWSPDTLAAANWVIASVLAGLAGILVSPIAALNPVSYTLLVVPALAAALVGRLSSFGVTVAAALALGMVQSELLRLQERFSWIPRTGAREALPLVVVLVALAVGGGKGLGRGAGRQARLPLALCPPRPVAWAVAGVAAASVGLVALGPAERLGLVNSMIGAVVCLSLVVLTGYVGQISLAQMAFAGVAGFSLSKLAGGLGLPFPVAPLLAAAAAAVVGVALGVPALRLRGLSLAVVTLAGAVAVEELVFKSPAVTGGFGGTPVPEASILGLDLGLAGARPFGFLVLAVLAGAGLGVAALRRGAGGRRFLAVRANEQAAAAVGVDVVATKLAAFALSAFVAGLGGALVGYGQGQLSFGSFGVFVSLSYLAVAYVGGIASIAGALIGGLLVEGGLAFTVLERAAGLGRYQLLVSGAALVLVAVLRPEGVVGRR